MGQSSAYDVSQIFYSDLFALFSRREVLLMYLACGDFRESLHVHVGMELDTTIRCRMFSVAYPSEVLSSFQLHIKAHRTALSHQLSQFLKLFHIFFERTKRDIMRAMWGVKSEPRMNYVSSRSSDPRHFRTVCFSGIILKIESITKIPVLTSFYQKKIYIAARWSSSLPKKNLQRKENVSRSKNWIRNYRCSSARPRPGHKNLSCTMHDTSSLLIYHRNLYIVKNYVKKPCCQ